MPTVLRKGPRRGMTTLVLENDPLAVEVHLSAQHLTIDLADGRSILVPLKWFPRLLNGSKAKRLNWLLLGDGYAIEWPDLDEHIGVEALLAGHPSGESKNSLNRWLTSRAQKSKTRKTTPSSKRKQAKK